MPLRILVAEDFAPIREQICALLRKRPDFQVVGEVTEGLEAVQKTLELNPDLILLDIGLPGIRGLIAAERIRKLAPHVRVLFVSQESSPAVVREAFRVGGCGYVLKYSAFEDLIPAIEAVLGYRHFVSGSLRYPDAAETHPRHVAQFYRDEAGHRQCYVRFIANAMKAGDATIMMAAQPHLEGVAQSLRAQGLDIDDAIQGGSHIALDAKELLASIMEGGVPDCDQFIERLNSLVVSASQAMKKSNRRVAIAGECCGLLCAEGNIDAAVQIEEKGNELIQANGNVDILCTYPMPLFKQGDSTFERVCSLHQAVHYPPTDQQISA